MQYWVAEIYLNISSYRQPEFLITTCMTSPLIGDGNCWLLVPPQSTSPSLNNNKRQIVNFEIIIYMMFPSKH